MTAESVRPGPRNLITDVSGIAVGNAEDHRVRTGVTVVLPDEPAVAAVDVGGGAPGTRDTALLDPRCLVERIDAIALSGGSAFGLDAAGGVMDWLAGRGRGFRAGAAVIPIVPAAILFDLLNGGDKDWGGTPPYRALAMRAAQSAATDFALGNAGAGLGAKAGDLKGGLGSASLATARFTVGALAAVNSFGSTVMPGEAAFWAWPFERDGELGGQRPSGQAIADLDYRQTSALAQNTTLVVVATDLALDKGQAGRVARMASDGLARAIRPAHAPTDGDTVFVLSTGRVPLAGGPAEIARAGTLAADCVARAIARGVYAAETLGERVSYRERFAVG